MSQYIHISYLEVFLGSVCRYYASTYLLFLELKPVSMNVCIHILQRGSRAEETACGLLLYCCSWRCIH